MALFGSMRSCYCLLYLRLLLDHSLADDDAVANTVIEQDPVGACMWPTPESAVMSCDSGSLVIIRETYMTRLVGRADKCSLLHSVGKPEYASCRLPLPANFAQQIFDNCNNTQQCTLDSFITGATVVTGSTTCGNGSDMALERNFLVIKWGCIDRVISTVAALERTTQKPTNILLDTVIGRHWPRNEGRSVYFGGTALHQCLISLALLFSCYTWSRNDYDGRGSIFVV